MTHTVFISHSSKDRAVAEKVCGALEGGLADIGVRCWVSWRDIPPSADWESSIMKALNASQVLVAVWTENANASDDVALEIKHALRNKLPVIPLRLVAVTPNEALEYRMTYVQWLDATTPPVERHLPRLVGAVRGEIEKRVRAEEEKERAGREARERAEREALELTEREARLRARAEAIARAEEEARQRARSESWQRAAAKAESASRRRASRSERRDVREYTAEVVVNDDSPLVGKTLADARLADVLNLTLMSVVRRGPYGRVAPRPDEVVEAGDVLLVQGSVEDIARIIPEAGIQLSPVAKFFDFESQAGSLEFFEAMVLRGSELTGRTLRSLHFYDRYELAVLAVSRYGTSLLGKLSTITLKFGDVLFLAGSRESFERLVADGILLELGSAEGKARGFGAALPRAGGVAKWIAAVVIFLAVLSAAMLGWFSYVFPALFAAAILLAYVYTRPRR